MLSIIAHRGCWSNIYKKNSIDATTRAFELGYGIEIDIRDVAGKLVVEHDVSIGSDNFLSKHLNLKFSPKCTIALNIKADGLASYLLPMLQQRMITNYFAFDMSLSEMWAYSRLKIKHFVSVSDLCRTPKKLPGCTGVWLDAFTSIWYGMRELNELAEEFGQICFVSNELHGRDIAAQWALIKEFSAQSNTQIMLCTDKPEKADEYFNGN